MNNNKFVALYHGMDWKHPDDFVIINKHIRLVDVRKTNIYRLYEDLCEYHQVDEGGAFEYQVATIFTSSMKNEIYFGFGINDTALDLFSNVLVLMLRKPIGMSRVIWTSDDFKTIRGTERIHYTTEELDMVTDMEFVSIDNINAKNIKIGFKNLSHIYSREYGARRLSDAFSYYYSACRSTTIEQMIVKFAIVLELLFSPHSHSEISHQVSLNIAKHIGKTVDKRVEIYKLIKRIYSGRSAIIHGGMPEFEKTMKIAMESFDVTTSILSQILLSKRQISIFGDEARRAEYIRHLTFD